MTYEKLSGDLHEVMKLKCEETFWPDYTVVVKIPECSSVIGFTIEDRWRRVPPPGIMSFAWYKKKYGKTQSGRKRPDNEVSSRHLQVA